MALISQTIFIKCLCILITAGIAFSSQWESPFASKGIIEMNKLNSDALFLTHKYILSFTTEDKTCTSEACSEGIQLLLQTIESLKNKYTIQPVWINALDNRRLVRKLRIVEMESIAYLANNKAVVYQDAMELKKIVTWMKKRLILPSQGYGTYDEMETMRNEHDLVVSYGGIKNQYYDLFRYIAGTYNDLHMAHSFSAPVSNSIFFKIMIVPKKHHSYFDRFYKVRIEQ